MTPDGAVVSALMVLVLWILNGIRDDVRGLTLRVGEHDSFITALKSRQFNGG